MEHDAETAEFEMAGKILEDLKPGENSEEGTPEAPYGFTREGTPRGKPGPKPGTRKRSRSSSRARTSSASKPKAPAGPDYRAGIRGMIQLAATPLALAGMKRPELMVDAATLTLHADSIADGIAEGAADLPQLQMVLDRIMTVGPWGVVLAPVLGFAAQILANHGILPAGTMGTLTRDEILMAVAQLQAQGV